MTHRRTSSNARICPAHGTEYVRWVQSTLNQVRALRLPLSGAMDASTRSALRSFQRARGLPPDGIAGPDTEQELRAAALPSAEAEAEFGLDEGEAYAFEAVDLESAASMPTLRRGSSGSAVSDLQRRLNAAGFNSGAVDGIFGSLTDAAVRSFQGARRLSVDGIAGPNTWGALLGAGAPVIPPSAPPSSAPPSVAFPPAWSNGPVNAPVWNPTMRHHSSIGCNARDIPTHLQPESVTLGWTARTQRIVDIIRGPLFKWTSDIIGDAVVPPQRDPASYHYCGRAIDAFPPGVAWQSRATGEGLRAGWRLANWAAHNAAAQNVSEVIFFDRIWTVARSAEGWRPYQHSTGSQENSLQHRDHVHISVY